MEESSGFGFPTPVPRIDLEMELEQRIRGLRNARAYCINETQEERSKKIETASYALEDFCTGFLIGLRMGKR